MNKNKNLYVVVPHRGVAAGKSRLTSVLDASTRDELNCWLLTRTLRIVSAWLGDARRCVVVSPCARTLALAQAAGATALPESASTQGLNDAVMQSVTHVAALSAQQVLVLPCDLPRLEGAALQAMVSLADSDIKVANVVIAPDRHGAGTNALLVDASAQAFAFGVNSFAKHVALAEAHGARALSCANPTLAFDLDTAEDLTEWMHSGDALPPFLVVLTLSA
jgi:2-phospho-L-lactate guanylyltransferase